MKKVLLISAIYKREEITELFFKNVQVMINSTKNYDVQVLIVGSEGEKSKKLTEKYGFNYIEHVNAPVSKKFNSLSINAKKYDPDYVVLFGSDDVMSPNFLNSTILEMEYKKIDLLGFSDLYFYDTLTDDLVYWGGYTNGRKDPIGCGRVFSSKVLEKLNWKLWGNYNQNRGLDGITANLVKRHFDFNNYKMSDLGIKIVDVKSDFNITNFKLYKNTVKYNKSLLTEFIGLEKYIKPETNKVEKVVEIPEETNKSDNKEEVVEETNKSVTEVPIEDKKDVTVEDKKILPEINILTRTSGRPEYFKRVYDNVKKLKYDGKINHIVSTEKSKNNNYLYNYSDITIVEVDDKTLYKDLNINNKNKHIILKHNLLINKLLKSVNNGYIIILDDDDVLDVNVLTNIGELNEDTLHIYNTKHKNLGIIPNSKDYVTPPKLGKICSCSYIIHSKWAKQKEWKPMRSGDFIFLSEIYNIIPNTKYIDVVGAYVDNVGLGFERDSNDKNTQPRLKFRSDYINKLKTIK